MPIKNKVGYLVLYSRLNNWKFETAYKVWLSLPPDQRTVLDDDEQALLKALANMFKDVGWFEGDLAELVNAAVRLLGVTDEQ